MEERQEKMDDKLNDVLIKAETLIEALPYIRDFNNKKVVVKYGGSAMLDEELQKNGTFETGGNEADHCTWRWKRNQQMGAPDGKRTGICRRTPRDRR